MKVNIKVRLKNPLFWLTIIPAAAAFVYTLFGCFGVVPPISQNEIVENLSAIVTALAALGVLVDPTTKGLGDSANALTYEEPK